MCLQSKYMNLKQVKILQIPIQTQTQTQIQTQIQTPILFEEQRNSNGARTVKLLTNALARSQRA